MNCVNCGFETKEDDVYCGNCGEKIVREEALEVIEGQIVKELPKTKEDDFYNAFHKKQMTKLAKTTLIFGVLSVILSGLNYLGIPVVHLFGIGFGAAAIGNAKKANDSTDKNFKTGKILGVIGLVLGIAAIIIGVVYSVTNL